MKYAWIEGQSDRYPVGAMCRLLGVSRSGYYDWRGRPESRQSRENRELAEKILDIRRKNKRLRVYGSPRMHEEVVDLGYRCSENRVARVMRENGIRARQKRKFRATTDSKHSNPVATNVLDRKFDVGSPDRAWVTDITYGAPSPWRRWERRCQGLSMSGMHKDSYMEDMNRMPAFRCGKARAEAEVICRALAE